MAISAPLRQTLTRPAVVAWLACVLVAGAPNVPANAGGDGARTAGGGEADRDAPAACLELHYRSADHADRNLDLGRTRVFTIAWTHSVEKERWEERFVVSPNGAIVLTATRFKTFGAGVPDHAGKRTRLEDGWVVMDGIDRQVDPYAVLATPKQAYRLRADGEDIALTPDGRPALIAFTGLDGACDRSKRHGGQE